MRQYASPYVGMGNNPVNQVDPDGRFSKFGAWWRNGFSMNGVKQVGGEWGFNKFAGQEYLNWSGDVVGGNGSVSGGTWIDTYSFHVGKKGYGEGVATISAWNPGLFDKWGQSDNFLAQTTYSMVDGPYVTAQFFTPWRRPTHLNDELATGYDGISAFASTGTNLLPVSKVFNASKISASQFSQKFVGTLARLTPQIRGHIINTYNKVLRRVHNIMTPEVTQQAIEEIK